MGDFKINPFNPVAWLAVIYYKFNNWCKRKKYDKLAKKNTKYNKK